MKPKKNLFEGLSNCLGFSKNNCSHPASQNMGTVTVECEDAKFSKIIQSGILKVPTCERFKRQHVVAVWLAN